MGNDLISVVIPSGRPERVGLTIRSLLTQNIGQERYEIIVVTPDRGPIKNTLPAEIKVITTTILYPPGRMRNIGARQAKGEYLCFVDDDCLVPFTFLNALTDILQSQARVGAVGCRVVAYDDRFWNRCADQALFTAYQGEKSGVVAGLGSAALAVKRDAFALAGGFDEQLLASEDWDFSLKLQDQGWLCWFAPEVEVRHDHRRGGFLAILGAAWKYGKASGLVVQQRHEHSVSWVSQMMVTAARRKVYWLLMLPYSCLLTLVWLIETRPIKMLPCLPVLFLARLSYQCGVYKSLQGKKVAVGSDDQCV